MCGISRTLGIFLLSFAMILNGIAIVSAENESVTTEEDITVPVIGVTTFKYSPAGFQLTQPEKITTTLSEFNGHQLVLFLADNQSVLSVDAIQSNMTLDEAIADEKSKMETKTDYSLVNEEETTLGGLEANKIVFTYTDDLGEQKKTDTIIAVNNGVEYVLMSDANATEETQTTIKELIDSFEYIPIEDDNISKMIKTKMKQLNEPDKGYRSRWYSYSTYHYYSWDYYYDWCFCHSPRISYYCWCW